MAKKTWLEKNQDKMKLFPQRWYLIFRALDEFTGLADVYGGGCQRKTRKTNKLHQMLGVWKRHDPKHAR